MFRCFGNKSAFFVMKKKCGNKKWPFLTSWQCIESKHNNGSFSLSRSVALPLFNLFSLRYFTSSSAVLLYELYHTTHTIRKFSIKEATFGNRTVSSSLLPLLLHVMSQWKMNLVDDLLWLLTIYCKHHLKKSNGHCWALKADRFLWLNRMDRNRTIIDTTHT